MLCQFSQNVLGRLLQEHLSLRKTVTDRMQLHLQLRSRPPHRYFIWLFHEAVAQDGLIDRLFEALRASILRLRASSGVAAR